MAMGGGGNMKGGGGGIGSMTDEEGGGRLIRLWNPSLSLDVGDALELPESPPPDERLERFEDPCKMARLFWCRRHKREVCN